MRIKNNYFFKFFFTVIFLSFFSNAVFLTKDASALTSDEKKSPIMLVLCKAVNFISQGPGKIIAMLILISLAIALFLGKVTWGLAIAVGVGIGVMLGAGNIMAILGGGDDPCAEVLSE